MGWSWCRGLPWSHLPSPLRRDSARECEVTLPPDIPRGCVVAGVRGTRRLETTMASSEQAAGPALKELLKDGAVAGEWIVDPSRSAVSFKSGSMWGLVRVHGVFRQVTGNGTVSPTGEVSGALTVSAASVDTKNAKRDTHLRSADFFDSDK